MSSPNSSSGRDREAIIAKTAGFIVFSGIAISILKTLNPFKKNNNTPSPLTSSFNAIPQPPNPCLQPQVRQLPIVVQREQNGASGRLVEIEKGDTLWGFSQKFGVSIDVIKEANGLTGNTIYAGKKLIIP